MSYAYDTAHVHAVKTVTVVAATYTLNYGANGNLTSGYDFTDTLNPAGRTIAYNSDNMPAQIVHSTNGTTTFTDDGSGTRAKKSGPNGTTYYYGALFEKQGSTLVKYIFANDQRVAMVKSGKVRYFHEDHLGSATVVTDAAGMKFQEAEYMPFGGQRGTSAITVSNYGFTDQEKDPETGLYNYGARFYDPMISIFVSADSMVPDPGGSQAYNRYAYCVNNPLIYTDPSGHSWLSDVVDSIRGSIDPIKMYQDGGVWALHQWGAEPVSHSFQYTYDGGSATGSGYSYGCLIYGGGWQEKGPNHGFHGYVGLGYNIGDSGASVGIIYTHNYSQDTRSVGISIGYTHDSGASGGLSYDITNDSYSGSIGYSEPALLRKHRKLWEGFGNSWESYQQWLAQTDQSTYFSRPLLAENRLFNEMYHAVFNDEVWKASKLAGKIFVGAHAFSFIHAGGTGVILQGGAGLIPYAPAAIDAINLSIVKGHSTPICSKIGTLIMEGARSTLAGRPGIVIVDGIKSLNQK